MRGRKSLAGKVYPKYQPYPLTWDSNEEPYSVENRIESHQGTPAGGNNSVKDFNDLISDPDFTDSTISKALPSNEEGHVRPLRLLNSLFSDRLSFLRNALDELEAAKNERERLIRYALDELDPEIQECEVSLNALKATLNYTERRRNLERRLFELKRERRREALLSWRDLTSLKNEIRKLHREIDSLTSTTGTAKNREAPT